MFACNYFDEILVMAYFKVFSKNFRDVTILVSFTNIIIQKTFFLLSLLRKEKDNQDINLEN